MKQQISSPQNPLVKSIVKLQQKASERKKTGHFVVEGRREVSLAIRSGVRVKHMLVCEEIYEPDSQYPVDLQGDGFRPVLVSQPVYNKLAYRENQEGLLLVGMAKTRIISEFRPRTNPLVLVLEGVEKPGNLGAILRTADAADFDAVVICDPKTDIYNPNVIRASLGCVFTNHIISCEPEALFSWLRQQPPHPSGKKTKLFGAALQTEFDYYDADFSGPSIIVFGAEDKGLSDTMRKAADQLIKIPMAGTIDSLNVSVSVAILAFEAVRQRRR